MEKLLQDKVPTVSSKGAEEEAGGETDTSGVVADGTNGDSGEDSNCSSSSCLIYIDMKLKEEFMYNQNTIHPTLRYGGDRIYVCNCNSR